MQRLVLLVFASVLAIALGAGQYYVPRSYYMIDEEGHQSAPVSLRRLRRSIYNPPYYGPSIANANANAVAKADGTAGGGAGANANAVANANANAGWSGPSYPGSAWYPGLAPGPLTVGAANPASVGSAPGDGVYVTRRSGTFSGTHSVSAGSSVDVDGSGRGHFDQYAAVGN